VIYLLIGAAFAGLIWLGRRSRAGLPGVPKGEWRVVAGVLATVCLVAAVAAAARGAWPIGLVLGAASVWLTLSARRPAPTGQGTVSDDAGARAILGVGPSASAEEIQAAYLRLMRSVHPDRGGTTGLAAQLNAARDRLLGKA
jgi:hypothetical protein